MAYQSVVKTFSRTAERLPDDYAIIWSGHRVTYSELEDKSNAIARCMVSSALARGGVVVILAENPIAVISSIIGTLRAGGVFAPLDPAAPLRRLGVMLEELAAEFILVESKHIATLASLKDHLSPKVKVFSLDPVESALESAAEFTLLDGPENYLGLKKLTIDRSPEDMCYVYFTSGSTGKPKGIAGQLKGVDHFIKWEIKTFGIREGVRVSQLTAPTFDAYLRDIFVPLSVGGTVCVPDDKETVLDQARLIEWIDRTRVAVIHCVPSLFRSIVRQNLNPELFSELKYILMAGEPLMPTDVKKWMDVFGDRVQLVNLYGPSETTMVKFCYLVNRSDADRQSISIGKPIEGARAIVVDESGRICPPGEVGEIYIRTPYRSLGYYNQPGLTQDVFIPNPFNSRRDPNDIVYKTGDLGWIREDGNFEILGRKDYQVKLNGIRIEPAEIENVLLGHQSIKDVAVVHRADQYGESSLWAYAVLAEEISYNAIREFLSSHLPDYMIPSHFLKIGELPRTSTGKVDRAALSAPDSVIQGIEDIKSIDGGYLAPGNAVEAEIAKIWSRVLAVEPIGRHDNFFALGGNSLLAPQIVARIRTTFDVDFPLLLLFENPTVASLAKTVEKVKGQGRTKTDLPEIIPDFMNRIEPFPLTAVQEAYWVGRTGAFELGNVATHTYIEFESRELDVERYIYAWQQLVRRHDMLRAVILADGRQQILADVPLLPVEILDLRGKPDDEVQAQLETIRHSMSHEVLPSNKWPLLRLRVTLYGDGIVRLHVSYDLLISDAQSNRILSRELLHYYQNPDEALPPLDLSFRDYVLADVALRDTELYLRSWDYWKGRLDSLPPAPELPMTQDPSQLEFPRFSHQISPIGPETWSRIKRRAAISGITPSGLVLAVFAEVLGAWSKSQRFCINVTLFNRLPMHPQVNEIVGDFTSITILEIDRTHPESFEARARRVQSQLWNDLDHRYVSGIEIIRNLQARRGGSRKALYPVVFTSTLIHDVNQKEQPSLVNMVDQVYRSSQTSQVWLDNVLREEAGTLWIRWNAIRTLFFEGMLEDMFSAFCGFLERLGNDESAWQEITKSLTPREHLSRRAIINQTDAPIPTYLLQELFDRQAQEHPGKEAVISPGRSLSYGELRRLSTDLGSRLRQMEARPNDLVAVIMEKGWEQILAVLAILKAGAAYLPIDPTLPKERLWYLLENSGASIALTQSHLDWNLELPATVRCISIDVDEESTEQTVTLEPLQSQDDLAYVIYTSGSTGLPKGAMLTHKGVVNRVLDVNRRFQVTGSDRALALTALHHDLSVYDIFGILTAGGTLVIPSASAVRDPAHWVDLMNQHEVTLWNSVPAFMEMLVEYLERGTGAELPHFLRIIMLSGDWIPVTIPSRIRALKEDIQVVSLGGPTETTIWDICYPVSSIDPSWKSIPYGKPMLNHRYYVLDEMLEPRPDWVPGELYAAGPGLARGYWNDEERTRNQFLTHPRTGERLYRTGDLGRFLPDGNIEFLGRSDFQVKIQGWRIELGEVEAALSQHPSVRSNVVTVHSDNGSKRLVAYVVLRKQPDIDQNDKPEPASPKFEPLGHVQRLRFKLKKHGIRPEPDKPSIKLTEVPQTEDELANYISRRSYREFRQETLNFDQFSALLRPFRPVTLEGVPLPKYRYASAGGLYPVQIYLYVKPQRIEGVGAGTYYYNPIEHKLIQLHPEARLTRNDYNPTNRTNFDQAAFAIFFVAQLNAIRPVYGEISRDFCMIEAGLMTSLLENTAPAQEIGLCHIGGLDFKVIRPWFDLQESHTYLYSLVGSLIDPAQTKLAALIQESKDVQTALQLIAREPEMNGQEAAAGSVSLQQSEGAQHPVEDLTEFLRRKLPQQMVPGAFVFLDELPLSANGKVDRSLLPGPEVKLEAPPREYVAPTTDIEERIAAVWRDVLGVEKIGLYDNFFDIGGNSLKLIRVQVKLCEVLNANLSIAHMFDHSTVSSLAGLLLSSGAADQALNDVRDRGSRQRDALSRGRRITRFQRGDED
jgi:amino acid adenylation domain-containing protein